MKQIQTVIRPLSCSCEYDIEVNRLLSDGWTLKKRTVLEQPGEISEAFHIPIERVLYAELEREVPPFPEEITQ